MIKRVFKYRKIRYWGLQKNANRLYVTAVLANIFMLLYTCLGACRPQRGKLKGQASC